MDNEENEQKVHENEKPQDQQEKLQEKQQQKKQPQQQAYDKEQKEQRQQKKEEVMEKSQVKTIVKEELWKPYDFLFPGGKLAKLIKVNNIYKKNLPVRDMLDKFKYVEPLPVVNIIGGMENGRGKFYAGVARAAFNTDAVIVDNGLASGLEKFSLRRGVKLVGVAPEGEIKFPRINPSQVQPMQLANGHTHLFLVNNPTKDLKWGGEVSFKVSLCLGIAEGKSRAQEVPRCKIVSILMGDSSFDIVEEIKACVENQIPLIVVPGSPLCDELIKSAEGGGRGELSELVQNGHFFYCNSTNSEDIAQLTHLLLTITPW